MPKTPEGWRALRVPMPFAEFQYLAGMRGNRKWRTFLQDIQKDHRKALEVNQELREKIEFLEEQLRRERSA